MFNLLRMDIRRMFKTRSFYIVLAVTAGLILLVGLLAATMADPEFLDGMEAHGAEISEYDRQMGEEICAMSQLEFASECLESGFLLVMIGIGMTLLVHGDFSSGYIKNICFARARRWEYVASKVLTAGVYSGILTVLSVLVTLIAPHLFGLHPAASPVARILQYTFWMWLPNWAFGLMGLLLVLVTRSSTLGIAMAVVSGGGVTAILVQTLCQRFGWPALEEYLLGVVVSRQCVPMPDMGQMMMALGCSIGWAALYAAGSLLAMVKRDI